MAWATWWPWSVNSRSRCWPSRLPTLRSCMPQSWRSVKCIGLSFFFFFEMAFFCVCCRVSLSVRQSWCLPVAVQFFWCFFPAGHFVCLFSVCVCVYACMICCLAPFYSVSITSILNVYFALCAGEGDGGGGEAKVSLTSSLSRWHHLCLCLASVAGSACTEIGLCASMVKFSGITTAVPGCLHWDLQSISNR